MAPNRKTNLLIGKQGPTRKTTAQEEFVKKEPISNINTNYDCLKSIKLFRRIGLVILF